jgi:glucokinase
MRFVAALDVGGTKIAGGLVSEDGAVTGFRRVPTPEAGLRDPGLQRTVAMASELIDEGGPRIDGLGIGFPEVVTPDGRLTTREVVGWTEQPRQMLRHLASVTIIESDVRCGALAEAWFGAGAAQRDFVYISVGTGISFSHVIDRVPRAGVTGAALWMGALPIAHGLPGPLDASTELESYASGKAIANRFEAAAGHSRTTPEVFAAAASGNEHATQIIESAGTALGAAIGHLILLLDPGAVVIGGGMTDAPQLYWSHAIEEATIRLQMRRTEPIHVYKAASGPHVGVLGAACAVFTALGVEPPQSTKAPIPWSTLGNTTGT